MHNTQFDSPGTTAEVDPKTRQELKMETHLTNAEMRRSSSSHDDPKLTWFHKVNQILQL